MLANTITVTYSNDGTAAAVAHEFTRKSATERKSQYNTTVSMNDPSLPREQIVTNVTEPKPNAQSYGVRRADVAFTRDALCNTPSGGQKLCPIVIHVTTSLPQGLVTGTEAKRVIALMKAYVSSADFEKSVLAGEI